METHEPSTDPVHPSVASVTPHSGSADLVSPEADTRTERHTTIGDIIAEFSEIFAFARARWSRLAEDVHPDLKGMGVMILQLVLRKGPLTATGITQMLDMDKALVSRHISKLRELGFIDAEPAPEDRRVMLLTASPHAHEMTARIRANWSHTYHERFMDWDTEDLQSLRDSLHRFNASSELVQSDGPATRCSRGHAEQETQPHQGAQPQEPSPDLGRNI